MFILIESIYTHHVMLESKRENRKKEKREKNCVISGERNKRSEKMDMKKKERGRRKRITKQRERKRKKKVDLIERQQLELEHYICIGHTTIIFHMHNRSMSQCNNAKNIKDNTNERRKRNKNYRMNAPHTHTSIYRDRGKTE